MSDYYTFWIRLRALTSRAGACLAFSLLAGACGTPSEPMAPPPPPGPSIAPPEPMPEPAPTAEPTTMDADAGLPPPAPAWKDMDKAQRAEFMKNHVVPTMGPLFKEFDPKHFPEMTCVTCHGPGAKEGKFVMPNPKLPKITNFEAVQKKNPKAVKFMSEKVVPEMATLLGEQPFDPQTQQGFGCMRCHTGGK